MRGRSRREAKAEGKRDRSPALSYREESRRLGLSILVVLPLVVLYQVGIVRSGSPMRNLAEQWLAEPFSLIGVSGATLVNVAFLAALLYALHKLERTGPVSLAFMGAMVIEGALYGLLMFTVTVLPASYIYDLLGRALSVQDLPATAFLLAIGAGVYEELLFRVGLVGGGSVLLQRLFLWNKLWSSVVMLVLSALLFSAAHHVTAGAEQFDLFVFIFRSLCGLFLGVVFIVRGPGIAIWTHVWYNMLVLAGPLQGAGGG